MVIIVAIIALPLSIALRLYRRCGFTPIPYVPGHYAVSDVQMEQTL